MSWFGCDHKWVIIAAERLSYQHYRWWNGEKVGSDEPITEVLQRCSECRDVRTKTLDGWWTFAQLTAETAR